MVSPVFAELLDPDFFHIAIAFIIIPVAIWALWSGYRVHRLNRVLWLGLLGVGLIVGGTLAGHANRNAEVILMVFAGLILASAHLYNLRACRIRHPSH
jgi:CDP-diglyceride synthetase